jgi:hypothetical protein
MFFRFSNGMVHYFFWSQVVYWKRVFWKEFERALEENLHLDSAPLDSRFSNAFHKSVFVERLVLDRASCLTLKYSRQKSLGTQAAGIWTPGIFSAILAYSASHQLTDRHFYILKGVRQPALILKDLILLPWLVFRELFQKIVVQASTEYWFEDIRTTSQPLCWETCWESC